MPLRKEVRAAAALALSHHLGDEALPALTQTLRDSDPLTAGLAANALVKIGKAAVPNLIEAAQDGEAGIRILALRALSELRDHRAIPVMMKCIQEDRLCCNIGRNWVWNGLVWIWYILTPEVTGTWIDLNF